MSILDMLKGLAGGGQGSGNATLDMIGGLIQQAGGIGGLVSMLQQGGLGSLAESWIGNGANQPVSGTQLGQAFAGTPLAQQVADLASHQGVGTSDILGQLAQYLPEVVNHLTPNGQVPSGSGLNLGELAGLAGKLGL